MIVHQMYIPDARIVSLEPHHKVSLRICHECISTHRHGRELGVVVRIIEASVRFGPPDYLEVMSMQVEGVLACIVIVEYNLDDLALFKDEGVGVAAIKCRIRSSVASGESGI